MKKYFTNLLDLQKGATRAEWWTIAILTFSPWAFLSPIIFISLFFIPYTLLLTMDFLMGVPLIPLAVFLFLVTLFFFIHLLFIIVSIRRYKDLRMSPCFLLGTFIPFIGVLSQIVLLGFVKGKKDIGI